MEEIETSRLIFRNYKSDEIEKFAGLVTNERVMKYVGIGILSEYETENLWRKMIGEFYPRGMNTIWAIFEKENARYIGHCAIRPRPTKTDEWEITYVLREEEWGKGFATEIAERLIRYGFEELNLPAVFATIDDKNTNSIRVVEKAGMNFLRHEFDEDGRYSVYLVRKLSNQS